VEYYSAIERMEALSLETTWMNGKDIMLSQISQTQKDKYCMILTYMWNLKIRIQKQRAGW
jgi:hypothetical protein